MTDIYFEDIKARPDVFPSKWHAPKLDKHGVQYITGKINRGSQLSTKSRLNSSYWKKAPLDKLIESYNDDWRYSDQLVICVWDINQKESDMPIGFISFDFCWEETKPKKINYIGLTVHLIWVRPEKRGLGGVVARHIISHFLSYLEDCNLSPPKHP